MKHLYRWFLLLATLTPGLSAGLVYDNSTADSGDSVFFSVGPYTEIGDRITLGGTNRLANEATVELYNGGSDGNFNATLRFYLPGSPVGAVLGVFSLIDLFAASGSVFQITFTGLNLTIPDEMIFTLAVSDADSGVDLGVNLYDPPGSIGESATNFLIVRDGTFSALPAGVNSNVYFQLDASEVPTADVPEPSTVILTAAALCVLARSVSLRA